MVKIKKIIIWGHKLHSHTHSYIHNAFYIAFKYLSFETYWFDDNHDVSKFDFSNSLFITEHQVDFKIPKRDNCLYFCHSIDPGKYDMLPQENIIELLVSFRDMYGEHATNYKKQKNIDLKAIPLNEKNYEFYFKDEKHYKYFTMWGTDLLPHELQNNIDNLELISKKREPNNYYFIGSFTQSHANILPYLQQHNIQFKKGGATFNINSNQNMSIDMNAECMQRSVVASAFQYGQQLQESYIPCRIFKNISYGRMGITNNKIVNDLFNNKLIYDPDPIKCLDLGVEFENRSDKLDIVKELMYKVKDEHTYISRIESMKYFINNFTKFSI